MDSIALSIFSSRIEAVCDEMGAVLKRVAFSPNIKDRLDFSCAVFDARGELCAQAAHIPVHLGSMAFAAKDIVKSMRWSAGDMVVLNDPYLGGTHLPDITLIAPIFIDKQLMGFVANRAHHADIGAKTPGSMPVSSSLSEEGLIIPPTHLLINNEIDNSVMQNLLSALQNPMQSQGDFSAQISANRRGLARIEELIKAHGVEQYRQAVIEINEYAARLASQGIAEIKDGRYSFSDFMDDDGQGNEAIKIKVNIDVIGTKVHVDFTGTANQVSGNINCPNSVVAAAVYYVFRCLMPDNTPACAGSFRGITFHAPKGCLLNSQFPAAVAAGNVETSTRIVDVVCGALVKALPKKIPAASHGSMNNIAMGSRGDEDNNAWDYYETIGGGMGGNYNYPGLSGVQTHMTNTLNTPIEVLEMNYPLRVNEYSLRKQSAGKGEHKGGQGICRSYTLLKDTHVTLLTERRRYAPWGIGSNDCAAQPGENLINGTLCSAKFSKVLKAGTCLTIKTPGGGGFTKS